MFNIPAPNTSSIGMPWYRWARRPPISTPFNGTIFAQVDYMRLTLLVLTFLLAISFSPSLLAQITDFKIIENSALDISVPSHFSITHSLPITVVVFKGLGWRKDVVKNRLYLSAQYFQQCGIQLKGVQILEIEVPKDWIDNVPMPHGNKATGQLLEIAENLKALSKPIIFYIGRTKDEIIGYARTERNAGKENLSTANTIFISSRALSKKFIAERGALYMTEAHELGHLLGDWLGEGHTADPRNIMSGSGTSFYKEQCETYRMSDLVFRKN